MCFRGHAEIGMFKKIEPGNYVCSARYIYSYVGTGVSGRTGARAKSRTPDYFPFSVTGRVESILFRLFVSRVALKRVHCVNSVRTCPARSIVAISSSNCFIWADG